MNLGEVIDIFEGLQDASEIGKALKELGIRLKDKKDNYLPLHDVLEQVSDKYDSLTDEDKKKIFEVGELMVTEIITIDKDEDFDAQIDYMHIARKVSDGKLTIGYLNIDKPWYQGEDSWEYYLRRQVCWSHWGNQTWVEELVDKDSIMPYTGRNYEIYAKENGIEIKYEIRE